jgi:hypothetical protein
VARFRSRRSGITWASRSAARLDYGVCAALKLASPRNVIMNDNPPMVKKL